MLFLYCSEVINANIRNALYNAVLVKVRSYVNKCAETTCVKILITLKLTCELNITSLAM